MRQPKPRPQRKPWELNTVDLFHEKVYAQKRTRRYELFFNYLRISRSYFLASLCSTEEQLGRALGDMERASKIWRVWSDVGDVYDVMFKPWWIDRGLDLFGVHTKRPQVELISYLSGAASDEALVESVQDKVAKFVPTKFEEQGRPDSIVVSVPLGQSRPKTTKELYELVSKLIEQCPVAPPPSPKYVLEKNKIRDGRLEKGFELAFYKTVFPKWELWRAASQARISTGSIHLRRGLIVGMRMLGELSR